METLAVTSRSAKEDDVQLVGRSSGGGLLKGFLAASLLVNAGLFTGLLTYILLDRSSGGSCASSAPPSAPLNVHRVPMNKRNRTLDALLNVSTTLSELRAHPGYGRSLGRFNAVRRLEAGLEGAAYADYSINVTINEQTFEVIVDTGSSTFAVAASASDGCVSYYDGSCDGKAVSTQYGSGSWTGAVCEGATVKLNGLPAGTPNFAGILTQKTFLTDCAASNVGHPFSEGILGMAYSNLIDSSYPLSPLFDSVVSSSGEKMGDIFSMQCCGWDGVSTGTGEMVLGGTDSSLYTGTILYTPITKESYYCVDMKDAKADSASSDYSYAGDNWLEGWLEELGIDSPCETIVDSGTSELVLSGDYYTKVREKTHLSKTCVTSADLGSLPSIVITLKGGVTLTIPPNKYYQKQPSTECLAYFVGSGSLNILGQVVMEQYYTIFDRANKRVGFAESTCA